MSGRPPSLVVCYLIAVVKQTIALLDHSPLGLTLQKNESKISNPHRGVLFFANFWNLFTY